MANIIAELMKEFDSMTEKDFDLLWEEIEAKRPSSLEGLVPVEKYKENSLSK
ncbi:MAG: hypothetical protein MJ211_14165 [Bacteroidales bacterium]|nr:hypothetical protein [Bacteroidales bacterium]